MQVEEGPDRSVRVAVALIGGLSAGLCCVFGVLLIIGSYAQRKRAWIERALDLKVGTAVMAAINLQHTAAMVPAELFVETGVLTVNRARIEP